MKLELHDHHSVQQIRPFLDHALGCAELRLQRMALLDRPLAQLSQPARARLISELFAAKVGCAVLAVLRWPLRLWPFATGARRLTDSYLDDPGLGGGPRSP